MAHREVKTSMVNGRHTFQHTESHFWSIDTISYNVTDIIKEFRNNTLLRKYSISYMEELNINTYGLYQVKQQKMAIKNTH